MTALRQVTSTNEAKVAAIKAALDSEVAILEEAHAALEVQITDAWCAYEETRDEWGDGDDAKYNLFTDIQSEILGVFEVLRFLRFAADDVGRAHRELIAIQYLYQERDGGYAPRAPTKPRRQT